MPKVKRNEKESDESESASASASESSSSDSSGPDDVAPPAKKKSKTSAKASPPKKKGDDHSWNLDKNRIVKVKQFQGKVYVDIREYYQKGGEGELLPGKKGISLTPSQWEELKALIPDVDESLKAF